MNHFKIFILVSLCFTLLISACSTSDTQDIQYDLVIQGGRVMDPNSELDSMLNVGITDGIIAAISSDNLMGTQTINADGNVVAPGFININAHDFSEEHFQLMVKDGITTALQTEIGTANVSDWYRNLSDSYRCTSQKAASTYRQTLSFCRCSC